MGIDIDKEEHPSTDNEKNLRHDAHSAEDVDDFLTTIRTQGLDLLEGEPEPPRLFLEKTFARDADEIDLNPISATLESANDPVRVYLREMGASPLLTREGEVEIAKRIERGEVSLLKALSRSPIVIHEVLAIGEDLKTGRRSRLRKLSSSMKKRSPKRFCRSAPMRSHVVSTNCINITKQPSV